MSVLRKLTDEDLNAAGVGVAHHFMYAKETHIPAGAELTQHKHKYDHYSMLLKGRALVECDGVREYHNAPTVILIKAGIVHKVTAVRDCEWWCLHETDERDIAKIDESLIEN